MKLPVIGKVTTSKVVTTATLGLLIYEGYTLINKDPEDTISETLWKEMRRPLIPFALGALVSHFVWQSQDVYDRYAKEEFERRQRERA